jgi:hypothetical protein
MHLIHKLMISFVDICALSITLRKSGKWRSFKGNFKKVILNDDSGVQAELDNFRKLIATHSSIRMCWGRTHFLFQIVSFFWDKSTLTLETFCIKQLLTPSWPRGDHHFGASLGKSIGSCSSTVDCQRHQGISCWHLHKTGSCCGRDRCLDHSRRDPKIRANNQGKPKKDHRQAFRINRCSTEIYNNMQRLLGIKHEKQRRMAE